MKACKAMKTARCRAWKSFVAGLLGLEEDLLRLALMRERQQKTRAVRIREGIRQLDEVIMDLMYALDGGVRSVQKNRALGLNRTASAKAARYKRHRTITGEFDRFTATHSISSVCARMRAFAGQSEQWSYRQVRDALDARRQEINSGTWDQPFGS